MVLLDKQHPLHADLKPLAMLLQYPDWQDAANGRLDKLADTLTRRARWQCLLIAAASGAMAQSALQHLRDAVSPFDIWELSWAIATGAFAVWGARYCFRMHGLAIAVIVRLRALAAAAPVQEMR